MATFSLVHGAWHGGWCWNLLREALEARGHEVQAPDLPCEDVGAGVEEYAAVVPVADVAVGHSLGGFTLPYVEAQTHVFITALVAGAGWTDVFVPGFGAGRIRDELGRSYYPDPTVAARELQYPSKSAHLASRLRRQAPFEPDPLAVERPVYVVCARDAAIRPEWQRRVAREVLGVEPLELESGHSPMLECPGELAALLDAVL
jgi:pimeloyl-ACP methyl ester carboxylesterase